VKVYVKTPARLHLGLIDFNGDLGRFFGGLGVGINRPNVILEAQKSVSLAITGEENERVKELVNDFIKAYNLETNVSINVKQSIPEHVGLGSGTQLSLAIATALSRLFDIKASVLELSQSMGRGQRTSVGTTIFEKGGFVVDGGKSISNKTFPATIFRQPFPQDWVFVVVIPEVKKGLSKSAENAAFKALAPMKSEDVGRICRLTMMKLLPSLVERDIRSFGEALTQIQIVIGNYFAEVQGGTYSSKIVAEGIKLMQRLGAYGTGQSSWGPAFYGLTQKSRAKEIETMIKTFLKKNVGGQVFVAKANNRGAYIKITR
jgi:beta-ribofuranosylaminobenzene 5'-phosphate synthase